MKKSTSTPTTPHLKLATPASDGNPHLRACAARSLDTAEHALHVRGRAGGRGGEQVSRADEIAGEKARIVGLATEVLLEAGDILTDLEGGGCTDAHEVEPIVAKLRVLRMSLQYAAAFDVEASHGA